MQKTLRVMDRTGDTAVTFYEADAESVRKARALYEQATKKASAVFAVNRADGAPDRKVTRFEDLEEENVVVPAIVGG